MWWPTNLYFSISTTTILSRPREACRSLDDYWPHCCLCQDSTRPHSIYYIDYFLRTDSSDTITHPLPHDDGENKGTYTMMIFCLLIRVSCVWSYSFWPEWI
ncbi:hypothetical protein P153DRAFT_136989 [Dothidotthia symphoricarpi CBS 119687]|uniref:Uncharacterized protein n=1 Tax=Dothidotthia symphoricarpi CBS 119687 TaxID=1392245 RepID=A0A6A5ZY32_9PLEO|nr:uncharacterized protein P153DRAFT_136989 [Dothidotthia symphoricarpi CBS 119687]KAF2124196.1 hypothetical protein P153DRAFT_136989 [Dothidotthia symphoricarpi CBS 119687]